MSGARIGSLFSGIGALDLAIHSHFDGAPSWFVEQEEYPRQVLAKRFPGVPIYKDVREVGSQNLAPIDVLCGGPPCQDLSTAGRRSGLVDGERSSLFFDFARIAKQLRPRHIVIENVPALLSDWRGLVERTLAPEYGLTWCRISAANVGAPHLRWRVFVLGTLGATHGGACYAEQPGPLSRWTTPTARDYKDGKFTPNVSIDLLGREVVAPSGAPKNSKREKGRISNRTDNRRLAPSFVEVLMGLPLGWTDLSCDDPQSMPWPAPMIRGMWGDSPQHSWEPARAVTTTIAHRRARLQALGNAVVPAQALAALQMAQRGPQQQQLFSTRSDS